MGVNTINGGTATYAMQKAQAMPKIMIDPLLRSLSPGNQFAVAKDVASSLQLSERAAVTGKGTNIDLVA